MNPNTGKMTAALVSFLWRDSPFGGLATLRVLFKLDKDAEENYACPTLPSARHSSALKYRSGSGFASYASP